MTENPTNDTERERLLILIGGFLESQKNQECFNDYDVVMEAVRGNIHEKCSQLSDPLKTIAQRLFEISDQAHFLFHVLKWKTHYLAEGLKHAVESVNPMSLANNARSLLEHIATFSAVGQKIEKLESDLDGQQSAEKILAALESTQSFLQNAYYGKGPKGKSDGRASAIHITDSLRSLKKEIPNIDEYYDFLCEFVHPNYGSNQLVSSGKLASGHFKPSEEFNREILDKLRRVCSNCFFYLEDQAMGHLAGPLRLQMILERCFVRGAKANTVFARKQHSPLGDGKSKETAYFFPKARTTGEAMELFIELFEKEDFSITGLIKMGDIDEEFIYSVYPTDKGEIWVKKLVKHFEMIDPS